MTIGTLRNLLMSHKKMNSKMLAKNLILFLGAFPLICSAVSMAQAQSGDGGSIYNAKGELDVKPCFIYGEGHAFLNADVPVRLPASGKMAIISSEIRKLTGQKKK